MRSFGASLIHASRARLALAGLRNAEVEDEIAVTLGRDLPLRDAPYGPDDLRVAIAAVHLVECPIQRIP